jgi:flagellar assembly factor FliW
LHIETTRFGSMQIDERMLIHFPDGLLGFPDIKHYVIFEHDQDAPFKWLQATDEPALAFVIMDPFLLLPDYQVEIQAQDLHALRVHDTSQVSIFVILTIPAGQPARMTANLKGPVLVNGENRWAKQLVLTNSQYHTRHPLLTTSGTAG